MIKKILDPYKVFISILIAAAFWLAPIGTSVEQIPVAGQIEPLQEFSDIPKLVLAIVPEVSADCAAKCKEPVCLKWVPIGGSCQPTNPWDIGCCTKYGERCATRTCPAVDQTNLHHLHPIRLRLCLLRFLARPGEIRAGVSITEPSRSPQSIRRISL